MSMSNYVDLTRTPPSKRRKVSSPMKENLKNNNTPIRALKKLLGDDEDGDADSDDWVDTKDDPMEMMFSHHPIAATQNKRQPRGRLVTKIEKQKPESPVVPISLGPCQNRVIELVMSGQSVFFTGCAGTGKSTLLKHILGSLPKSTTYVTASTGIAAVSIGGTTLHSFAGVGKGDGSKLDCLERANKSRAKTYWRNAKVLVIDEVSMVDGDLFDKLDYIGRVIRRDSRPFGGLQLIVCGDFLQLPPISKGGTAPGPKFCFEAECWEQAVPHYVELRDVYRQSDRNFVQILSDVRRGNVTKEVLDLLQACQSREFDLSDGIEPTVLYPLNRDVDSLNQSQLTKLPADQERVFYSSDVGMNPFLDHIKQNCTAPEKLTLRVGAQVMLLANLNAARGLVTGARGVVVGFDNTTPHMFPRVKFCRGSTVTIEANKHWSLEFQGKEVASRRQVPLKLAWALSIHRCQGQTLDRAIMKLDNVFEFGQAYVALSRVTSVDALKLIAFNPKCIKAHPRVLHWYESHLFNDAPEAPTEHQEPAYQYKEEPKQVNVNHERVRQIPPLAIDLVQDEDEEEAHQKATNTSLDLLLEKVAQFEDFHATPTKAAPLQASLPTSVPLLEIPAASAPSSSYPVIDENEIDLFEDPADAIGEPQVHIAQGAEAAADEDSTQNIEEPEVPMPVVEKPIHTAPSRAPLRLGHTSTPVIVIDSTFEDEEDEIEDDDDDIFNNL